MSDHGKSCYSPHHMPLQWNPSWLRGACTPRGGSWDKLTAGWRVGDTEVSKQDNWPKVNKGQESLSRVWLCNPMDCSPPGSSVHGILQATILEWVTMPLSRGSSQPRDQTLIAGSFFTVLATSTVLYKWLNHLAKSQPQLRDWTETSFTCAPH